MRLHERITRFCWQTCPNTVEAKGLWATVRRDGFANSARMVIGYNTCAGSISNPPPVLHFNLVTRSELVCLRDTLDEVLSEWEAV